MIEETKTFEEKLNAFYLYVQRGNGLFSEFKNLIQILLIGYFALKLDAWWLIPIAFLLAIPIFAIAGWYSVHKMSKIQEKISVKFGTHYAINQFEMIKESRDLTKESRDILKEIRDSLITKNAN